jgi:hypothetical protein
MLLTDIARVANNATDENYSLTLIRDFTNEAIGNINIAVSARLPYFTEEASEQDYTYLGEEWIRSVIIPYVCFLIKVNDGSLNEANSAFYQRYNLALTELKKARNRIIPISYRMWWEEASVIDYQRATYKIEASSGINTPASSYLPPAHSVQAGTVAVVYNQDKTITNFYKIVGGTGVMPMGKIGSNNTGWFRG